MIQNENKWRSRQSNGEVNVEQNEKSEVSADVGKGDE